MKTMSDDAMIVLQRLFAAIEAMDEKGISVTCTVCGRTKAPRGRSVPMEAAVGYCQRYNCSGYDTTPAACSLWDGEKASDFGYGYVDVKLLLPVVKAKERLEEIISGDEA